MATESQKTGTSVVTDWTNLPLSSESIEWLQAHGVKHMILVTEDTMFLISDPTGREVSVQKEHVGEHVRAPSWCVKNEVRGEACCEIAGIVYCTTI